MIVDFKSSVQKYPQYWIIILVFTAICRVGVATLWNQGIHRTQTISLVVHSDLWISKDVFFSDPRMLYVILKCLEDLNRKSMEMTEYRNKTNKFDLPTLSLQRLFHHARASQVCPHSLPSIFRLFRTCVKHCEASNLLVPGPAIWKHAHAHTQFQTLKGQVSILKYHGLDSEWIHCSMYDQSSSIVRRNWPCSTHLNDGFLIIRNQCAAFAHDCIKLSLFFTQPQCMKYIPEIHHYSQSKYYAYTITSTSHHVEPCGSKVSAWIQHADRLFNFGLELTTKILTSATCFFCFIKVTYILCYLPISKK